MLIQFHAKVGGEVIDDHVAAVERLQQQYLSGNGLSLAGRGREQQHPSQHDAPEPATRAGLAHELPHGTHQLILLCARIYPLRWDH
ncbi:hypothetical protein D3C83_97140 [compost metagenome]